MEWIVGVLAILTAVFGCFVALFIAPEVARGDCRPKAAIAWMGRAKGRNFIFVVAAGIFLAIGGMFQTSVLPAALFGGGAMAFLAIFLARIYPAGKTSLTPKIKRRLYGVVFLSFGIGAVCILARWMMAIAGAAVVSPFYLPAVCGIFDLFAKKGK